jgi:hypothetical protein
LPGISVDKKGDEKFPYISENREKILQVFPYIKMGWKSSPFLKELDEIRKTRGLAQN